ncbi:MAG TPA: glycine oxidase ThiO [Nitriliruptorales bacterium]|nr:glycine oxidase ThiO [Nitriliruptorales bacterium]
MARDIPHAVPPADAVVIGAGAIGMAIAWRVASHGVAVALVDERPGRGSSWAAAGMLAPVTEAHHGEEELLELNLASRDRWPDFAAALEDAAGRAAGYRESGTVVVARDRDDLAELDALQALLQRHGLAVERLTSGELRQLEPGLSPGVRGGLLAPDDHQVDNRRLVGALSAACQRAAVTTIRQHALGLDVEAGRVSGCRLADGSTIRCDTVVLAAGARSGQLAGLPPGGVPVRPVKGQLLHLRPPPAGTAAARTPLARHNVRVVAGRPGRPAVYAVPRTDGRLVVGATVEERGFDPAVTAGAVLNLLREAYELLPAISELELAETVVGFRPGTPDNAPLLGPGPLDGLVLATGHFRNGILLAPVTADIVTTLLTTGELVELARPFTPQRFAGARARVAP